MRVVLDWLEVGLKVLLAAIAILLIVFVAAPLFGAVLVVLWQVATGDWPMKVFG